MKYTVEFLKEHNRANVEIEAESTGPVTPGLIAFQKLSATGEPVNVALIPAVVLLAITSDGPDMIQVAKAGPRLVLG